MKLNKNEVTGLFLFLHLRIQLRQMSDHTEDKKPDFSKFPRGAISIKGLPVNRNARLPSIRIPRDLTLGAAKRTFTPNIPVRREKRAAEPNKEAIQSDASTSSKQEIKPTFSKNDRGRGRGRGKDFIQTEGALFEQGIAAAASKDRKQDPSYSKSGLSSKGSSGRKAKADSKMADLSQGLDLYMRDDFINDGSDEDEVKYVGPVMFPIQEKAKKDEAEKNVKQEKVDQNFNDENFAKDLGFDVTKISKFIKKEKSDNVVTVKPTKEALFNLPQNDVTDLFRNDEQCFLIKLPHCFTVPGQDQQSKSQPNSTEKQTNTSIAALPEGRIGKIQILKSGAARLVIGSLNYNLDYVKHLSTKHELVSVNTESGDLSVLAGVKDLLNVSPDIVGSLTALKLDR
ncbi:hypothetical protein JTE90_010957 [Oedothorax gibbosus]|uniref:DNA-directed RNA polymerase III subunit RPC4 n=1 Tax=Oedothorax gibbosus TaxID=931172 RepID=A0AAV6UA38_9ARAC|nr:hypothetical protein JTE90_010957 [Oedothorax gibbosus]